RLRGLPGREVRLQGRGGPGLLGAAVSPAKNRRKIDLAKLPGNAAAAVDERLQLATPLRRVFNKVFPDHWSFLLGEIALYSFIVLLLTGTFLALFFDPSMVESKYNGSYVPMQGVEVS